LQEDEVYVGAKKLLIANGWTLLGGQPPRGSNHLPVIEIKWPERTSKGSFGAYKPDLLAYKDDKILLIECKPRLDWGDIDKLQSILSDRMRIDEIFIELRKRRILSKIGTDAEGNKKQIFIEGAVAHSEDVTAPPYLWTIQIHDSNGKGEIIEPRIDDRV
jgi:hypothetical protein